MRYFNSELPFWRIINRIPEIVALSFLWVLLSIPIVTIPCASMALYDSIARNVRPDEKGAYRRFFRTFRQELKQGVMVGLLWAGIMAVLLYIHYLLGHHVPASTTELLGYFIYRYIVLLPVGIMSWLAPLQSRFALDFKQVWKNAIIYYFAYFPYSVIATILLAVLVALAILIPPVTVLAPLFMPAVFALIQSFWVEKAFKKEIEKHLPPEELEALRLAEAKEKASRMG